MPDVHGGTRQSKYLLYSNERRKGNQDRPHKARNNNNKPTKQSNSNLSVLTSIQHEAREEKQTSLFCIYTSKTRQADKTTRAYKPMNLGKIQAICGEFSHSLKYLTRYAYMNSPTKPLFSPFQPLITQISITIPLHPYTLKISLFLHDFKTEQRTDRTRIKCYIICIMLT